MATLADIIDGADPEPLYAHLSTTTIVEPASLATIVEADWDGYVFAPVTIVQRLSLAQGFGFLTCVAQFFVGDVHPLPIVTALYLTGGWLKNPELLSVMKLTGGPYTQTVAGENFFTFDVQTYVVPNEVINAI